MNMKKNGLLRFFTILAAVALSLPMWLSALTVNAADSLDYGTASSDKNKTLWDVELVELLTGEQVSSAEAAYLKEVSRYSFTYCDSVPQSGISAEWKDDTLYVCLKPWAYTAANGETVIWAPEKVTVNGVERTCAQDNGVYTCSFAHVFRAGDPFDISAEYVADFVFDKDMCNMLFNCAYDAAQQLSEAIAEYESKLEQYTAAKNAYEAYCRQLMVYEQECEAYADNVQLWAEYNEKLAVYQQYLEQKRLYEERLEKYKQYVEAQAAYAQKCAQYEQYLKDKEVYEENAVIYRNYLLKVNARTDKLAVINNMFTCDSVGRNLYATLMGDTVATVVDHKDEIVNYAMVDASAVDAAGMCTENLQKLLTDYKNCPTDKEKYLYYEAHYDEIKDNLNNLYECLHSFYQNKVVITILAQNGKLERYRMFVTQLYVITTAMDDDMTRDPAWVLGVRKDVDKFGVEHFLEPCQIPEDRNDASPAGLVGWPDECPRPIEPEKVEQPTQPTPVELPGDPPPTVIQPKEPEKMQPPTPPTPVSEPGDPPSKVEMTEKEKAILAAYRAGELKERRTVSENIRIALSKAVEKHVEDLDKHYVTFLDGSQVIQYANVSSEEAVIAPPAPEKTSDAYIYTFKGWVDGDGNYWQESTKVDRDTEYYAVYDTKPRTYKVTWIVGDRAETVEVKYGDVPRYEGSTDKTASRTTVYTFIGWDNKPAKVTGDVTYTACYSETDRYYTVTWVLDGNKVTEQYVYGATPSYQGRTAKETDTKYLYTFMGWDQDISPVAGDVTYEGVYKAEAIVPTQDNGALEITSQNATLAVTSEENSVCVKNLVSLASAKEYGLEILLKDGVVRVGSYDVRRFSELGIEQITLTTRGDDNGNLTFILDMGRAVEGMEVTVEFPIDRSLNAGYYRISADGVKEAVACYGDTIRLMFAKTGKCELLAEYRADLAEGTNGRSKLSVYSAEAGEKVTVEAISVDYGYAISQVRVRSMLSGELIDFDRESMSFLMPVGGAEVEVIYSRREFTVTFMHDGNVLSSDTYYMGDKVRIPEVESVIVDGEYYYTFKGWDTPVIDVVGDATYNAVYAKTVMADRNTMNQFGYQNRTYMYFVYGGIAVALIAGVVVVVRVVKKKKACKP